MSSNAGHNQLDFFDNVETQLVFESEGDRPWEGRPESRVAAVLNELRRGPITTNGLLGVSTHRFACEIHQLRQRGFQIETKRIGETQARYTLVGYEPTAAVSKKLKDAYYRSAHWQSIRISRLEIDGFQCTQCKSKENLHVHHWVYHLFSENALTELQTFCQVCHWNLHERGSVKISFPKRVSVDCAQRLKSIAKVSE